MPTFLRSRLVLIVAWLTMLGPGRPHVFSPRYHLARRIVVDSGAASYLALDAGRRRLYGAGTRVIDVDSNTVIGKLPPHTGLGFALAPDLGKGLGRRGIVFDLSSFASLAKLNVAGDAGVYDPASHHAFLIAGDTIVGVDMVSDSVIGRVSLRQGRAGNVRSAVADGRGRIYVNVLTFPTPEAGEQANEGLAEGWRQANAEVMVLDAKAVTVVGHLPLRSCGGLPTGLSMDRANRRLFVSCPSRLLVVDPDNGRGIATVPVNGQALTTAFDSTVGLIFSPAFGGHMTIVHEDSPNSYQVVSSLSTGEGGNVVVVDEHTHRAFVPSGSDPVHVVVLSP